MGSLDSAGRDRKTPRPEESMSSSAPQDAASPEPLAGRKGATTPWCPSSFQGGRAFSTGGLGGFCRAACSIYPDTASPEHPGPAAWGWGPGPAPGGRPRADQPVGGPCSLGGPCGLGWTLPLPHTPHMRGGPIRWEWALVCETEQSRPPGSARGKQISDPHITHPPEWSLLRAQPRPSSRRPPAGPHVPTSALSPCP